MFEDLIKTDDGKPGGPVKQRLGKLIRWLLILRGSPRSIGLGVAIGLFCALSPLLGLQLVLAIVLSTLLGANRPAAVATTFANNPTTFVPVFALEYWVGSLFWPGPPVDRVKEMLTGLLAEVSEAGIFHIGENLSAAAEVGRDIFVPMMIGGTLLGLVAGVAVYFPIVTVVGKLHDKRRKKREQQDTPLP